MSQVAQPLPVLLGLGDLERETNITCSYCWDQALSLQVKASLVLLLWWDLPLWDKTSELGWDSKSWNFIAKCHCPWSLLLWPLLMSDIPNLYQMSQEVLSVITSHLLIPSPRNW